MALSRAIRLPGAAGPVLGRVFGLDLRSLALFRILLACVLIGDLLNRARDLEALYTDFGAVPRDVLVRHWPAAGRVCLHLINGSLAGQITLFAAAGLAHLCLLVGLRTWLAQLASWLLLLSLHGRNPLVLYGADDLLRMLLFWSLFVPLGEAFSVDSTLPDSTARRRHQPHLSVGGVALLLQVAMVYWTTAALKTSPEWRRDGTAIFYALANEQFVDRLGVWLRSAPPSVLHGLTFGTLALEAFAPFLLFSPVAHVRLRMAAIAGLCALHVGLFATMALGIFPFVSIVAMVPFIPPEVWGQFDVHVRRLDANLMKWYRAIAPWAATSASTRAPLARAVAANLAAGVLLVYVALANLGSVPHLGALAPRHLQWLSDALRLDQEWDMFAPAPMREDGWYVMPGLLENGKEVDVYAGKEEPVTWARPPLIIDTYRNDRWQTYLWHLWEKDYAAYLQPYGRYLCRSWNARRRQGERLAQFRIYLMSMPVPRSGVERPVRPILLWDHRCF